MPRDQHMTRGPGRRQSGLARRPAPRHAALAMADHGQHGAPRRHQPAVRPRAALTPGEVGGSPRGGMEGGRTQDPPPAVTRSQEPRTGGRRAMGGRTRPAHAQPPLMPPPPAGAADHPPGSRAALTTHRRRAAARPEGREERAALRGEAAEPGRGGPEGPRPVLRGRAETQEPGALGEGRQQGAARRASSSARRPASRRL
jgi:hypothetical protein